MTKFQKAVSVCMSLCFFVILAVLPGQFFFRENVYRQLPLYCFLEEKAASAPPAQDRETYEKIVSANGAYLGEKIRQEQLRVKRLREESKMSLPEEPGIETSVLPHPVIDLSPEKLADREYLLNQFFVEDAATEAFPGLLNAARFLEKKMDIKQDASAPQILIYHSHASEAFADSREGVQGDTIVGVGSRLAQILKEKYGYHVIHIKEAFDMAGGTLDRSKAYDYAGEFLTSFLEKNPSIEVILDVHRDGVPEERRLVTEINGKKTAQVMFYNGISYTKKQGKVHYLPNPYIEDNLAFSFQMEYQAAQYYPDFYRCIYLAGYRYNLHFRPKSMLLEVGAQNNTVQEAKNAMEPFAELLNKVLQG